MNALVLSLLIAVAYTAHPASAPVPTWSDSMSRYAPSSAQQIPPLEDVRQVRRDQREINDELDRLIEQAREQARKRRDGEPSDGDTER